MERLFGRRSRGLRNNGQTIWCLNRQLYRIILKLLAKLSHRALNASACRAGVVIVFLLNMRLRACLADGSKYPDLKLLLFSLLLRRECQRPTRRRKNNLGTRENGSSTHKANTNLDVRPEGVISALRCQFLRTPRWRKVRSWNQLGCGRRAWQSSHRPI